MPNFLQLVIDQASISENGGVSFATISRSGDIADELIVSLESADINEASVPDTVLIPAGESFAQIQVVGVDDAVIDGAKLVAVTASAAGFTSGSDEILILDDDGVSSEGLVAHWTFDEAQVPPLAIRRRMVRIIPERLAAMLPGMRRAIRFTTV